MEPGAPEEGMAPGDAPLVVAKIFGFTGGADGDMGAEADSPAANKGTNEQGGIGGRELPGEAGDD